MQVSKERLEEFKAMYYRHHKAKLSDEEAYQQLNTLVGLLDAIYRGGYLTTRDK